MQVNSGGWSANAAQIFDVMSRAAQSAKDFQNAAEYDRRLIAAGAYTPGNLSDLVDKWSDARDSEIRTVRDSAVEALRLANANDGKIDAFEAQAMSKGLNLDLSMGLEGTDLAIGVLTSNGLDLEVVPHGG